MAMEDDSIEWFSPDPRAILPLEDFHAPHALRRLLRKRVFETKIDNAFSEVIAACAKREDTWINREIIESYTRLHELGHAHSVEAWKQGRLAGGLYGVAVGGAFCGESMFHRVTDASKIALVALVEHLRARKISASLGGLPRLFAGSTSWMSSSRACRMTSCGQRPRIGRKSFLKFRSWKINGKS